MDETVATTVTVNPAAFNSALYIIVALFVAFLVATLVAWKRANKMPEV